MDGRGGRGEKIVSMKERKLGRIICGEASLSLGFKAWLSLDQLFVWDEETEFGWTASSSVNMSSRRIADGEYLK